MHYHRSVMGGATHMQGKSWKPGTFKYKSGGVHEWPDEEKNKTGIKRKTATYSDEEREASRKRVEETHHEAERAEHAARGPDATPAMQAEAQHKRHEANLAHVNHADKFDSVEAHDAAEAGRDRFWDSQVGAASKPVSRFTEAEPMMHVHPALHGFLREAEPKMHVTPTPYGFAGAPQTYITHAGPHGYEPTGQVTHEGYRQITTRAEAGGGIQHPRNKQEWDAMWEASGGDKAAQPITPGGGIQHPRNKEEWDDLWRRSGGPE